MRRDSRQRRAVLLMVGAALALCLLWAGAAALLIGSTLAANERAELGALLGARWPLLFLPLLGLAAGVAVLALRLYRRHVAAPAQLQEQAQVLLDTDAEVQLDAADAPALQALAQTFNALAAQRAQLRRDIDAQVAAASRSIDLERNRLAALMDELSLSVVVCNLDGRVVLYNQRARLQFRALSTAPRGAGGAELIGLGRSIYGVFDRRLVVHALEHIQQRLKRGAASPSARFVTPTAGGQLLRAHMAPVREEERLGGFVLMLENITREHERDLAQDRAMLELTGAGQASLSRLLPAMAPLDDADLDAAERARLLRSVRDELQAVGARLQALAQHSAQAARARWPLEDMLGTDLVAAAQRRIEVVVGIRVGMLAVDPSLWLHVDSYALLQALTHLAHRLNEAGTGASLALQLGADHGRAVLDLTWPASARITDAALGWGQQPMSTGAEGLAAGATGPAGAALSVRDVLRRHGGELEIASDTTLQRTCFRFRLPRVEAADPEPLKAEAVRHESRPEVYDFDLFQHSDRLKALEDQGLAELTFTVFDTETTGLEPSAGDEIIQIGAVRIVGGRLLRQEAYEQLVDPKRSIPEAGIPIHGIRPEMVRGQPAIGEVLPVFHAYARDSVLVAHNAAFDMRFLQLKEDAVGLKFDQPVLDTLLLSAVVHPNQASHRLEAIAERFGITVVGRHTALGDAIVTAEIWLKLVPLLAAMDIHTLAQAREAAQKTYYARLKY